MRDFSPLSPEERRKRQASAAAAFGPDVAKRLKPRHPALEIGKRIALGVYADGFIHAGNLAYLSILALFPFFILAAAVAAGDHLYSDSDRGAADPLDPGIDRDQVVQQDRRDEGHRLDRHGCRRPLRGAAGDDAAGDVHLAQHPAAEDMAVGVDIGGARNDAQDWVARAVGLIVHSSCPDRFRKGLRSPRHGRCRSTGRRGPSAPRRA